MKNILAENMLRFGVKNLSKSATNKVKMLVEANDPTDKVPTEPTPPKISPVGDTGFQYVVGGGSSDQARYKPLIRINAPLPKAIQGQPQEKVMHEIDIIQFDGNTTKSVQFRDNGVATGGKTENSTTTFDDLTNPIDFTSSVRAVEKIYLTFGGKIALVNIVKALVWLNQNYSDKFKSGQSIIKYLSEAKDANMFATKWRENATKRYTPWKTSEDWLNSLKAAGLIKS